MNLILFDIDGTLLLSGGAGVRSMMRAFEELCGVRDGFSGISMSGRTDGVILREGLARIGLAWESTAVERFKARYFELLQEEIRKPLPEKRLLSGVRSLLDALVLRKDATLGLLTGNWRRSGYLKLGHFGIDRCFPFGAFSDDSEDRDALLPIALDRAAAHAGHTFETRDVWVVGDTPHDIQCARIHGARALGVSTGWYPIRDLARSRPDALLPDLTDLQRVISILCG